ncbi:MAG: hypothetical protein IKH23_00325 [Clostridiales bacterium]|nr:hypothetical protein [Clostridiales bacterium]
MKHTHILISAAAMACAMIVSFNAVPARSRVLADVTGAKSYIEIDKRDAASDGLHVYYETGDKTYGNKNGWKSKGQMTSAVSGKKIETIKIKLSGKEYEGGIRYQVLSQGSSKWKSWVADGKKAGTASKRLEAIKIELTGEAAKHYDVCYRTKTATYGWLNWAKNGEVSGTVGLSKKVEAIQIILVEKDSGLPGNVSGIVSQQEKASMTKEADGTTTDNNSKASSGAYSALRYEDNAVYYYDTKTGKKKTGWIKINGLSYYFDSSKNGKLTDFRVNDFFSKAVFIGNSTSEGLTTYFNSKGKNYLGGPLVAAKVSYTFNSDKAKLNGYMLKYKGSQLQAKALVKKAGSKYALIMMGTNDLVGTGASSVAKKYKSYIEGIQKENPGVVIYIQSTTPRRGTKNVKNLSNDKIVELNKLMKSYADSKSGVYFIDISTALKDKDGNMKKEYCSDGYVHLNMKGYKVWVNTVVDYVRKQHMNNAIAQAKKNSEAAKTETTATEAA